MLRRVTEARDRFKFMRLRTARRLGVSLMQSTCLRVSDQARIRISVTSAVRLFAIPRHQRLRKLRFTDGLRWGMVKFRLNIGKELLHSSLWQEYRKNFRLNAGQELLHSSK